MKKLQFVALLTLCIVACSCKKAPKIVENSCNLETISYTAPISGVEVIYSISGEGDFIADSWYYFDNNSKIEITNPSIPTEIAVFAAQGTKLQAGAKGSVSNGELRVSFRIVTTDTLLAGVDQCVQNIAVSD